MTPRLVWLLPLLLLCLVMGGWFLRTRQAALAAAGPGTVTYRVALPTGPWGELDCVPISIEPPEEFLTVSVQMSHPLVWTFKGYSVAALNEFIAASKLQPTERTWLLDQRNWEITPEGIVVRPPPALVTELDTAARRHIYGRLAECGDNPLQETPFSFRVGGATDWFRETALSPAALDLTRRLVYPRGNALCLSDWPIVLQSIDSMEERRQFLKITSRQASILLRLQMNQRSDLDALVAYWGRGGRNKDIRPLLQSLKQVEGGVTVDVSHLLPRFVRARIYNYPYPIEKGNKTVTPNCFWTAMNFFNDTPVDKYVDPEQMQIKLAKDYFPVEEPLLMGDVLLLSRPNGTLVHAANYVAADVVLTKNGAFHTQPWIFARMDDLAASYPSDEPLKLRAYRRKGL